MFFTSEESVPSAGFAVFIHDLYNEQAFLIERNACLSEKGSIADFWTRIV